MRPGSWESMARGHMRWRAPCGTRPRMGPVFSAPTLLPHIAVLGEVGTSVYTLGSTGPRDTPASLQVLQGTEK